MAAFPSFLDAPSNPAGNSFPRQAPSPNLSQQQLVHQQQQQAQQQQQQQQQLQLQQQQQNGGQGGPGGQGQMPIMFPGTAVHQLDLNHLWQQVQELSSLLETNRESTQGIVKRVGEIKVRYFSRL
jgi:hypothetical protein